MEHKVIVKINCGSESCINEINKQKCNFLQFKSVIKDEKPVPVCHLFNYVFNYDNLSIPYLYLETNENGSIKRCPECRANDVHKVRTRKK